MSFNIRYNIRYYAIKNDDLEYLLQTKALFVFDIIWQGYNK